MCRRGPCAGRPCACASATSMWSRGVPSGSASKARSRCPTAFSTRARVCSRGDTYGASGASLYSGVGAMFCRTAGCSAEGRMPARYLRPKAVTGSGTRLGRGTNGTFSQSPTVGRCKRRTPLVAGATPAAAIFGAPGGSAIGFSMPDDPLAAPMRRVLSIPTLDERAASNLEPYKSNVYTQAKHKGRYK